jgi:hypothetical protein
MSAKSSNIGVGVDVGGGGGLFFLLRLYSISRISWVTAASKIGSFGFLSVSVSIFALGMLPAGFLHL